MIRAILRPSCGLKLIFLALLAIGGDAALATATPDTQVGACPSPRTLAVRPSNIQSIIDKLLPGSRASYVLTLHPGEYKKRLLLKAPMKCVTVRCAKPGQCKVAGIVFSAWRSGRRDAHRFGTAIVEGISFVGLTDYGIAIYGVDKFRAQGNTFKGRYHHDISTKEATLYAEILDNVFLECERHCIEIGQNGNVKSRPSTSGTLLVRGNVFQNVVGASFSQRYNLTLIIDGNEFRHGNVLTNRPPTASACPYDYGQPGGAEPCLVPAPSPLRTEITNNTFSGKNVVRLYGRGVIDDTVFIKGNKGSFACFRYRMIEDWVRGHSNVQTTARPKLDSASDVSC